jgi:MFS family permease
MQAIGVTRVVALLYLLRNVVYTIASYPIGALSSRFTRSRYLATGYGVAVITFAGFTFVVGSIWWFIIFFSLAGIFIAWEDTVEGIAVRDYVDDTIAGTAYGILGVVNGFGDFTSSLIVGILWTAVGASWGFAYAFIVCIAGVLAMARVSSLEKADHDL